MHTLFVSGSSQPTERAIALDSAAGQPISNGQILELSAFESNQFAAIANRYSDATMRTAATPRYNCHGMTFASRRTGIFDRETIDQILREDGYKEVSSSSALPGDVIIYYAADGDAEHSGIVVSPPVDLGIPQVVSKWGKYAEFIHWANRCPYSFAAAKYYRIKVGH